MLVSRLVSWLWLVVSLTEGAVELSKGLNDGLSFELMLAGEATVLGSDAAGVAAKFRGDDALLKALLELPFVDRIATFLIAFLRVTSLWSFGVAFACLSRSHPESTTEAGRAKFLC